MRACTRFPKEFATTAPTAPTATATTYSYYFDSDCCLALPIRSVLEFMNLGTLLRLDKKTVSFSN